MAWIEGSLQRTFTVRAPFAAVVGFFCEPAEFLRAFDQLESHEEVEEGVWRWVLQEKNEKGIRFQADYQIRYTRDGDSMTWEPVAGNMRSKGSVSCRDLGDETEVVYEETISADLPIPRLAAKVFGSIVGREVSSGVGDYLDRATELLEADHS